MPNASETASTPLPPARQLFTELPKPPPQQQPFVFPVVLPSQQRVIPPQPTPHHILPRPCAAGPSTSTVEATGLAMKALPMPRTTAWRKRVAAEVLRLLRDNPVKTSKIHMRQNEFTNAKTLLIFANTANCQKQKNLATADMSVIFKD